LIGEKEMGFSANLKMSADASLTGDTDLQNVTAVLAQAFSVGLTEGTGANQANQIFADTRTLSASASEDLDLAGALTNALGASVVFTKIKAIIISASAANTNNVVVGNTSANGFTGPFGGATHTIQVRPGGFAAFACADATAWAVAAGTGDLLKIANSAGATAVTYSIILIGVA
jgi:hypothetical protein